jgi:hypothetical protein
MIGTLSPRQLSRRSGPLLVVSSLLAAAQFLPTATLPVGATEPHEHEVDLPVRLSAEEALRNLAADYSRDYGVSTEEAYERVRWQDEMRSHVALIEAAYPERFGGAWFDHGVTYHVVIRLKGDEPVPDEIEEVIASAPIQITPILGASHSVHDLEAGLRRVEVAAAAINPAMRVSLDLRRATVIVANGEPIDEGDRATLASASEVPLDFRVEEGAEREHTYGGRQVNRNGARECSTGFTVRHVTEGVTGVITAGHCRNDFNLMYIQQTGIQYALSLQGERYDADEDWEWHVDSEGHAEFPWFWDGNGYVGVLGAAARASMVNDYVCHWGATTGRSCGTITTIHDDPSSGCGPNSSLNCSATWVRVSGPT